MNKIIFFGALLFLALSCSDKKEPETQENKTETTVADAGMSYFGDTISPDGAIASELVETKLSGKDSVPLKISGKIFDVCQKKGCWMEMAIGKEKTMRVTFKDYAFFVPMDASGKTAIAEGYAYTDTVSVAMLKHYAEDAGKSKAEIDAIKDPEISLSFEARGVIIKK